MLKSCDRRRACGVLIGTALLTGAVKTARAADAERVSTMAPFSKGDVFVGATLLDNPEDDHAGAGRILQFDADLNPKGVLWVEGTTHLVGGLSFAPDGTLWGFDNLAWLVFKVGRDGRQQGPARSIADRALGRALFLPGGRVLLTEYFKGTAQPQTLTTRYKTLPDHPGQVGLGLIYEYDGAGKLKRTYAPDAHGGMSGSMAITHAVLGSDGKTVIYTSETGPRLMRFDVAADRQRPDLKTLAPAAGGPPAMFLDVARAGTKVLLPSGNKLMVIDEESGAELNTFALPGFGWAVVAATPDGAAAYVANWFTSDVAKISLADGRILAQTKITPPKCISGLAVFAG